MRRDVNPLAAQFQQRDAAKTRRWPVRRGRILHRLLTSFGRRDLSRHPASSRTPDQAQTADTRLGQLLTLQEADHAGETGILPLDKADGAFVARLLQAATADNQATIVGGRNVGDEYFGATGRIHFTDLDVLAVGAVVPDVSRDFHRYWACKSVWSLDRVLPTGSQQDLQYEVERAMSAAQKPEARKYLEGLASCAIVSELAKGRWICAGAK